MPRFSHLLFLAPLLVSAALGTPVPVTDVQITSGQLYSLTVTTGGGTVQTVYGRNRIVGGTITGFAASASNSVLVAGGTTPPASGSRAGLLADWSLETGIINPGIAVDAMTITFPQPIVNRTGPDLVVFEMNTGAAADSFNIKVNGVTVAIPTTVGTTGWGNTGYGTLSADVYDTNVNGAKVPVTTLADLEASTLTLNNSDTSQTVWGIALDLSDFGVPVGSSITSLTIWSTSTSVSIDPVMVAGLVTPSVTTSGPVIEEVMAKNTNTLEDEDLDYPDWVEIYNGTSAVVNLSGYKLSDDAAVPDKWVFPVLQLQPYASTYVFCSGKNKFTNAHPHANFTLAKAGGTLLLTKPDGTNASTLAYPAMPDDISYGALGVSQTLGYLETPTPGIDNAGRQAAAGPLDDVVFDKPSAVITGSTTLTMSLPATAGPGAQIRYTLTGNSPSETDALYSNPLTLSAGATVSARVFQPGALPSRVCHRSFIQLGADIGTNYNATGLPFSSNLPIIVVDSYVANIDTTTDPNGARPGKFSEVAVYDVNPATGKAAVSSTPTLLSRAGVHVRGQSSSGFSQKPYALEFWKEHSDDDNSVELLGMPADSDWVLGQCWDDKTFMRNYLMQQTMLEVDGPTAGRRCRFVEVIFNQDNGSATYSDYRGVYLLIESIKRSSDRSNVAKLNPEMTSSTLTSGGYIFKKDKTPYTAPFTPPVLSNAPWSLTYDISSPDPVTATQLTALSNYINAANTAIGQSTFSNPASANYYGNYLDWRSFIDKMIWQEVCKEVDGFIFSSYYSKDRGGPIRAYPFWDVDRSLGNANYGGADNAFGFAWWKAYAGSGTGSWPYWPRLFQDPEYTLAHWDRWWKLRRGIFDTNAMMARIEAAASQLTNGANAASITSTSAPAIQNPASRHFRRWATLGTASYGSGPDGQANRTTFRSELDLMKSFLTYRLDWLDAQSTNGINTTIVNGLRPPSLIDLSTGLQRYSGSAPPGSQFALVNPNELVGTVYYTVNGGDPRATGGSVVPGALTATAGTTSYTTLINAGASWKYLAPSADPGTAWRTVGFDDSTWGSGATPIGYNEAGMTTSIVLPNVNAANPSYYRNAFTIADATTVAQLNLEMQVDDGAVVYINGVEAARSGMPYPPTPVGFTTIATGSGSSGNGVEDSRAESNFNFIRLNPALLVTGANTIAIEVHQTTTTGNDMRFNVRLKASAAPTTGTPLTFASGGSYTVRSRALISGLWTPVTEASFIVDATPAKASSLVVSELLYHPLSPTPAEISAGFTNSNDFEFMELLNISTAAIDLTGVKVSDAVTFDFTNAPVAARFLPPGGRVVLVANQAAFNSRLRGGTSPVVAGVYAGNFKDSGETVTLTDATGAVIKSFTYSDIPPWPQDADGNGSSLVLNNPYSNPDHNNAKSWRPSAQIGGGPGTSETTAPPVDPMADGNANGFPDMIDYVLGPAPNTALTNESYTPPTAGALADTYLYFRFPRNLSADGFTIAPELSSDLTTWNSNALVYVSTIRSADGSGVMTYRSAIPVSQLGSSVFARVRVTGQ